MLTSTYRSGQNWERRRKSQFYKHNHLKICNLVVFDCETETESEMERDRKRDGEAETKRI